jgi:predicted secreted protein
VSSYGSSYPNPPVFNELQTSSPWITDTRFRIAGINAARSGAIQDGNTTSMEVFFSGEGVVSFDWRVHCPGSEDINGDGLSVYLDDNYITTISGATNWIHREINVVGAGEHSIRFTYRKDLSPASAEYLFGPNGVQDVIGSPDNDDFNGPDGLPGTADDFKDKAYVDNFVFTPSTAALAANFAEGRVGVLSNASASSTSTPSLASGNGNGEFSASQEGDEVVYRYQIDTSRADSARQPQISADGITWQGVSATEVKLEGALKTFEVRGPRSDASYNFFRLIQN